MDFEIFTAQWQHNVHKHKHLIKHVMQHSEYSDLILTFETWNIQQKQALCQERKKLRHFMGDTLSLFSHELLT